MFFQRVAIFVDAGYLFAQGGAALTGAKKPRHELKINEAAVVAELQTTARQKSGGMPLLRIYWYDGVISHKGPTLDQSALAQLDDVKVRFGHVNSQGEQKGVDSLIVTDLIELARNTAITDAVLLSGDEDVRIGVQIAQSFGVRVHLIGIAPSRGSQSPRLIEEADTTCEWDKATVQRFLTFIPPPSGSQQTSNANTQAAPASAPAPQIAAAKQIERTVEQFAATLADADIVRLKQYWAASQRGVPPEFDGRILGLCRSDLGRALTPDETRHMRRHFQTKVSALP